MAKYKNSKEDDGVPVIYGTSHKFPDNRLAEMICDIEKQFTGFVVSGPEPGEIEQAQIQDYIDTGTKKIMPLHFDNPMLQLGFLKFPPTIETYKDDKFLFGAIKHYLKKYVYLPQEFYDVVAVYVMFTWLYDQFPIVPYLRVIGGFGSGKTRFLQIVGNICYKAMFFSGSTSNSAVFRTLSQIKGTMVFDETDFKSSEMWADIIKILNAGHDSHFPVLRMEPLANGGFSTRVFDVFGPKILASRQRFTDEALESRCITQWLHYENSKSYPIILSNDYEIESGLIRKWLLAFRFRHYKKLAITEQTTEKIKTPRVRQTYSAMLIVAKLIGEDIADKILESGLATDKELKSRLRNSFEVDILICLLEMLNSYEKNNAYAKKIRITHIADWYHKKFYDELNDREDRYFKSDETGEVLVNPNYKVSARRIGTIISKLGIRKDRDADGFCILASEYPRIFSLGEYHGISTEMLKMEPQEDENDQQELPIHDEQG